jgi:putative transposase
VHAPGQEQEQRGANALIPALWVADVAYIPTWAGFLYLAVVLDALNMAFTQRRPTNVIHRSRLWLEPLDLSRATRFLRCGLARSAASKAGGATGP